MNNSGKKVINKTCAILVILLLTISDFLFVGQAVISYAINTVETNNSNVDFSAYFLNSNGEKVEKLEADMGKGEEYLYIDVSVKNEGYFNGTISLNNSNFNIKQEVLSQEIAEISNNKVTLNQINAGTTVTIKLAIQAIKNDLINNTILNTQTEVQLTGQYVNSKNVEKDTYIDIKGTTYVQMHWKSSQEIGAELQAEVLTNSIYEIEGQEKRIVQILVNSKLKDNNYPVQKTEIELDVPNNIEKVSVHSRSTMATNSNINFGSNNYIYNEQSKKLTITLSNEDTSNISWNKNAQDTLIITYIFDKDEDISNIETKIASKIETYDNKQLIASENVHIKDEIDGIITHSLETKEESIYKGKIYTGEERDYTVTNKIYIDYLNIVTNLNLKGEESAYITNSQEGAANIIYKQTKIDKEEFLKLFGEEGYITIKDSAGITIANINKNTETDENGKITINYLGQTKTIEIETSKPIALGTLNIENTKAILDAGYSRRTIDTIIGIKETATSQNQTDTKTIEVKDTETEAQITTDIKTISTIADSQEILIEATLKSDDESKDLYKEPTVTITLPKELTILSAQYAPLYNNGLEVSEPVITKNENGQNEVKFQIQGEQQKYDSTGGTKIYLKMQVKADKLTPSKTTSIEMTYTNENKDITKTTSTELKFESQYGLMIYNQMENYNDAGESIVTIDSQTAYGDLDINAQSKEVTLGTAIINNFDQAVSNVVLIGKIPLGNEENVFKATLNNIQVSNSEAKITYSSNIDATLNDNSWGEYTQDAVAYKIELPKMEKEEVTKIKIIATLPEQIGYSESGSFTTTTYCDYQNQQQVNSSNILLSTKANMSQDTQELKATQVTESGLDVEISTLIGNDSITESSSIYEGGTIRYKVTVTNNTQTNYTNVTINATQKNGYVWDGVIKSVYNPNNDLSYEEEYYEISESNTKELGKISNLNAGESYTFEYEASAYSLDNANIEGNTTYGTISIVSENGDLNEEVKTIENTIREGSLKVELFSGYPMNLERTSGGNVKSRLVITNTTQEQLTDLDVKVAFSKELTPTVSIVQSIKDRVSYVDEEIRDDGITVMTLNISYIAANDSISIELFPSTEDEFAEEQIEVWMLAEVTTPNQDNYVSNKLTKVVRDNTYDIQVGQIAKYENNKELNVEEDILNDGEKVIFVATIFNNEAETLNIDIEYNIDKMIDIQSITHTRVIGNAGGATSEVITDKVLYNNITLGNLSIIPGETITIEVIGTIDALETDSITNVLRAYEHRTGKTKSSSLSIAVNPTQENLEEPTEEPEDPETPGSTEDPEDPETPGSTEDPENPENPETPGSTEDPETPGNTEDPETPGNTENPDNTKNYTISGTAWVDKDKDGKRNNSEEKIANVEVAAMNSDTAEIVKTTKTNEAGEYSLVVPEGNYIILFYYNNELYTTTTYKVSGASENENSDAIGREITINGETLTVGTTDIINVNTNIANVDIGLILRNTFDLKISKYVSNITVTNSAGTKDYKQSESTTLAKADIRAKNLDNSLVVIEYKIRVTNVGDVAGYARSIVDYMPSSLNFNSSLNSDWYLSGGNLYNTSLANQKIEAGETKELTLVLTKTMTESNTGLINNKASINESSSLLGIEDETQDTGSADVIISVSTGALVNYVITTLTTLIILAILAYFINKKYLSKRI